jgi:hypothetical protein
LKSLVTASFVAAQPALTQPKTCCVQAISTKQIKLLQGTQLGATKICFCTGK